MLFLVWFCLSVISGSFCCYGTKSSIQIIIGLFLGLNDCIYKPNCETYPGGEPLSEIETQNVATYLARCAQRLVSFFDIHSYAQLWLSPWGRNQSIPLGYSQMVSMSC